MEGFALLCGHLLGDYILQNDWMAQNKTAAWPGWAPFSKGAGFVTTGDTFVWSRWREARAAWHFGHLACLVHCIMYTASVYLCSFWWMPWWGLLACFLIHFPIDRWRLAKWWMMNVSGQREFATGPMSPWSIIIVDNVFHLLTLLAIAALANQI